MRKYLFVAIVAACVSGGIVAFVAAQVDSKDVTTQSQALRSELTDQLASNPEFIASVQSRSHESAAPNIVNVKGDKGDPGATGAAGTNGASGIAGSTGSTGAAGEVGAAGTDGNPGPKGDKGDPGAAGAAGPTGATGPAGAAGATGATGSQGIQGIQGMQGVQGIQGDPGVVAVTATGLAYDANNHDISLATGYVIPLTASVNDWNTVYSWGNHASAGYAVLSGKSGGQQLTGGTSSNEVLTLRANSASAGNTSTAAAIHLKVGNAGAVTALTVRHDGNIGIGTSTPASKLTVGGDITITTTGTDSIKPIQFIQVTGLSDNPSITTFNGLTFSTADWNPAVVGFQNGGSCGSSWTGGTLTGFKYTWENNSGTWRLVIDQSGPNDGCNTVQVMFVRKEISSRAQYGF